MFAKKIGITFEVETDAGLKRFLIDLSMLTYILIENFTNQYDFKRKIKQFPLSREKFTCSIQKCKFLGTNLFALNNC